MDATNTILQPQCCFSSLHISLPLAKNTSTLTHSTNNNTCTRQSQTNSNTFTDTQQYIYKHLQYKQTLQTYAKSVWLSHGEPACWDWGGSMCTIIVCLIQAYEYTCRHAIPCMHMHVYYVSIAMFEEPNVNTHINI